MNESILREMKKAAIAAGKLAMKYYGKLASGQIEHKNAIDLVTVADKEVEKFVAHRLAKKYPGISFFGEEFGQTGTSDKIFILDPIDGTTNFVRQYPFFAISLAYREGKDTSAGVVHAPLLGSTWYAVKGGGAFNNRKRIHVSAVNKLIESIAVTGFACIRGAQKPDNIPIFNKVIYEVLGVRRDGSAAIDLCHVAEGKSDLFWEMNLGLYDYAAGVLILEEAGGKVTDFSGTDGYETRRELFASNGRVHCEFLDILKGFGY